MPPPDAQDASPSPEPDFEEEDDDEEEEDSTIMAEGKTNRASAEDKSPDRTSNNAKPASKSNAKDPSRPRRKKARRACYACQRAHLTCGDERPCLRCVKRGLQDNCHDGVRKKAKYLHDAPAEALVPGYHGNYAANGSQSMATVPGTAVSSSMPVTQPGSYYGNRSVSYPQYGSMDQSTSMGQQIMDNMPAVAGSNQQPIMSSPTQYQPPPNQHMSPVQDMSGNLNQAGNLPSFEASLFDPNDPSMFNFNISDYNFGNHYGALEFGMLGHMTSGAVNTPEMEPMDMSHSGSMSYDGTSGFPTSSFPYTQGFQNWHTSNRQGSTGANLWALQHNGMDAYAVADTTGSLTGASPHSQNQDWSASYQSNTVSPETHFVQLDQPSRHRRPTQFPNDFGPMFSRKRRRDTKQIYASVTAPYPYTQRFHSLTAFLQRRFPTDKRLRIAKALATIRPSFIALTKDLSDDDLIFMEQGFQRQLVDYDDTWQQTGTPSIICRRTGEVVSCNKEFSLVTGWRRDVLLGKEPNLNVNFGVNTSGTLTGTSTRGAATPRNPTNANAANDAAALPQPVFLAELMDQDSVVYFWEDFAERAFGASAAMQGACVSLVKYKTKDDPGWAPEDRLTEGAQRGKKQSQQQDRFKNEPGVKGESGMGGALGEKDGKIDMGMTWLVRRDMFDIPMMIVFNFLPII